MEKYSKVVYTNLEEHRQPETYGLKSRDLKDWAANPTGNYVYVTNYPADKSIVVELQDYIKLDNFYILLDHMLEGYGYHCFHRVHDFVQENNLHNKVIYGCGLMGVEQEYQKWLKLNKVRPIFKVYFNAQWYHRVWQNVHDYKLDFKIEKRKWFCCLNNRPHTHRTAAIVYLDYANLTHRGIVTAQKHFYDEHNSAYSSFEEQYNAVYKLFPAKYKNMLSKQFFETNKKLPYLYDGEKGDNSKPHDFNKKIYSNCLINLTTETFYFNMNETLKTFFFSEKTWKPIVAKQIFIIIGQKGILQKLRDLGFHTFGDYIDESYDNVVDNIRYFKAVESLEKAILSYNLPELDRKTRYIREHNFEHFKKHNKELLPEIGKIL